MCFGPQLYVAPTDLFAAADLARVVLATSRSERKNRVVSRLKGSLNLVHHMRLVSNVVADPAERDDGHACAPRPSVRERAKVSIRQTARARLAKPGRN